MLKYRESLQLTIFQLSIEAKLLFMFPSTILIVSILWNNRLWISEWICVFSINNDNGTLAHVLFWSGIMKRVQNTIIQYDLDYND